MDRHETTTTNRLTAEIIHSIAMALFAKAEELERFQRMQDETASRERPFSSDDDACYL